jgi:hypothetical protein
MSSLLRKSIAAQKRRLTAFQVETGISVTGAKLGAIPAGQTFREWCEELGENGLKVDGFTFTLANRPAMHFIYDLIPSTPEEAWEKTVVMMKCAQVGFTVMEMLASIYLALKFEPCKVGMYLPDMNLAAAKSSERFMPIVRTVPAAHGRFTMSDASGRRKAGEGNVMIRAMGESRFHFLWTSGKATTESFPMDVLSFDEVQGMKIADMEKTQERLGASRIKFTLMGSTAKWPDADIHHWYMRGTQHQFHTECPGCGEYSVLDEHFPECIGYDEDRRDYRYRCHHCEGWIDDPQQGEWRAKKPDARIISVHFPQFLSPTITPRNIIEAYLNADDMMNFFNRKLGKPYMDPSQVPVNLAHLNACAAAGLAAGVQWKSRATDTFMGIDQMGAFNVVVIKERLPDGRQALVHLEYIYADDPFARCGELMDLYGVRVCVVETLPNFNDAWRFAKVSRFKGRVFLAGYGDLQDEMMHWGDARLNRQDRKTAEEERVQYTVTLDQYKCMQVSMARIQKAMLLFPDPGGLCQEIIEKGIKRRSAVLKDIAFLHFQRTALVTIKKDPEQKKFRRKVVKVGIDPHTSYANMLCDVAWARAHGTGMMLLPEAAGLQTTAAQKVAEAMPGLPDAIVRMIDDLPAGVCGRCMAFRADVPLGAPNCASRHFRVQSADPGCMLFDARPK